VGVPRSQFRGLHENLLNVLVPLFGDGHSNQLVRGASFRAREPTMLMACLTDWKRETSPIFLPLLWVGVS
jgi:hypothetical protein